MTAKRTVRKGGASQPKSKTIRLEFDPHEQVTALGGLALAERLARRAGLWGALDRALPTRRGYDWTTIVKSLAMGLLGAPRGTASAEELRQDPALRRLVGLEEGVPEEATVWRALGELSADTAALARLQKETGAAARRLLAQVPAQRLGKEGFVFVFNDATLLEGSPRREGTKTIEDKGTGLLWTVVFVGPVPVAARLSPAGEGEATAARALLGEAEREVLAPLALKERALVLADSLHGNGPSLSTVEDLSLHYVVGARGLVAATRALDGQPKTQWAGDAEFERRRKGAYEAATCVCTVQCEGWDAPRTLVARRWKQEGDLFGHELSVLTNLTPAHPQLAALMEKKKLSFAQAVLWLYDQKGGCETHFRSLLTDLGLHHPPCQGWGHNAAFYAVGLLAGLLSATTAILRALALGEGAIATAATLRRRLWTVAARVTRHGRRTTATVLGLTERWREEIALTFARIERC